MKQKLTRAQLRALRLSKRERLILAAFVATNRAWVARHAVPLEMILRQVLRRQGIELRRLQQVESHPVYELWLQLGRSGPATKTEIEFAVRQAFITAGRAVKPEFVRAVIREDRAKVEVYAEG
jgi:hypothetical protein